MNSYFAWITVAAAVVQAGSAFAIVYLTWKLVNVTNQYARTADTLLKLDWSPDLRIANVEGTGAQQVSLYVGNLAKPAALVKQLRVGTGGRSAMNHPPQDVETYPLPLLIPGGQIIEHYRDVEVLLGVYHEKYNKLSADTWQTGMSIALVYDCVGKENQTPWFDCTVSFYRGRVSEIRAGV